MPIEWKKLENNWQSAWEDDEVFEADPDPNKRKFFVTFPFPYMNGPLHVGHGFTATKVDVYARFKRMQGFNVLFPWAWHWTGETISGASKRLKEGDKTLIHALKEIDGVPESELKNFVDPVYMAEYYTKEGREIVKRMGFSVDWRREFHTTSHDPTFNQFITWQYKKLRKLGYVVKGTHPVVWCPNCESPTGEADRLTGEDVSPEEYILVKFKLDNTFLPCATFRPETIYGATNLWINPEAKYVQALVDGERWVISETASRKLMEQLRDVKVEKKFTGKEFIGKICCSPISEQKLPILPGWFVNPDSASGLVYSVPAHAPYDWLALRDLRLKPNVLKELNIDPKLLDEIHPISMIQLEGFGEFPAIELVDKMGVQDQKDPKADEATKILYSKEFHTGILKEVCGEYAGRTVSEVKEDLIQAFKRKKIVDMMYDLPHPVICRCNTPNIVKVLADQWFLKYSDKAWKSKVLECIAQAQIYPEAARQWFIDVVDWIREKACARRTGLGTPLPWDSSWIVETLSDSTVYMAYYTICKHVNEFGLKKEQLTEAVLDYIFCGEGSVKELSELSGISEKTLKEMRKEFLYWYPVDLRNSAKELLPNHLTFFLFQHVALFPVEHWPKAIGVNGMLMIEGMKMSKSKGNFVTLKSAIENYGADPTRCALMFAAEDMDDPNWRVDNVADIHSKLNAFYNLTQRILRSEKGGDAGLLERWLISMLQHRIKAVTDNILVLKTRTALENALFGVWNDLRWYSRRTDKSNTDVQREVLDVWVRLLSPFAPHLCEEVWKDAGNLGFVSRSSWPVLDENKIDLEAEETEQLVKTLLEDTSNILRATNISPERITFYTASHWKWKVYLTALTLAEEGAIEVRSLMKKVIADPEVKERAKQASQYAKKMVDEVNKLAKEVKKRRLKIGVLNEFEALTEASQFYEKEFRSEVKVYRENDENRHDPKDRAKLAEPFRPAIFIE
ncbi:leucine--tRNA ligase [Candidatus Bathyarchaeota archaeon]|nr:leucine--tRNA ligase [Candidatus Bathyarchaeota archaeon]